MSDLNGQTKQQQQQQQQQGDVPQQTVQTPSPLHASGMPQPPQPPQRSAFIDHLAATPSSSSSSSSSSSAAKTQGAARMTTSAMAWDAAFEAARGSQATGMLSQEPGLRGSEQLLARQRDGLDRGQQRAVSWTTSEDPSAMTAATGSSSQHSAAHPAARAATTQSDVAADAASLRDRLAGLAPPAVQQEAAFNPALNPALRWSEAHAQPVSADVRRQMASDGSAVLALLHSGGLDADGTDLLDGGNDDIQQVYRQQQQRRHLESTMYEPISAAAVQTAISSASAATSQLERDGRAVIAFIRAGMHSLLVEQQSSSVDWQAQFDQHTAAFESSVASGNVVQQQRALDRLKQLASHLTG